MKKPKNLKFFLIDGDMDGTVRCELGNSNIVAYKIPKIALKECKDREEIKYAGVYILFGDEDGEPHAYIGETENIYKRLSQHVTNKDFWNESIIFIRSDNSFNRGNIKYLESYLYEKAKEADRFNVDNIKKTSSSLTEAEICEMHEAAEIIQLLTNGLGYKIFKKIVNEKETNPEELYYINSIGLKATGKLTSDGFVVFKGSDSNPEFKVASSQPLRNKWVELRNKKIVDENNIFSRDEIFLSPSTAAAMVLGRNANGLTEWKNKDKKTIKDILKETKL